MGKYQRVKWVGNYAYLYDIMEEPIRRLTANELTDRTLRQLLPHSSIPGQFFRVKRIGPYAYLYRVTERPVRPLTNFEVDTLLRVGEI